MTLRPIAAALAGLLLASVAGCEKKLPPVVAIEGSVTLDGKPLSNAAVTFVPMLDNFGAESNSTGVTDEQGRFTLTCTATKQAGAVVGSHTVLVIEGPMPDDMRGVQDSRVLDSYLAKRGNRPIPADYGSFTRSKLKVEVAEGGGPIRLELTRTPAPPATPPG